VIQAGHNEAQGTLCAALDAANPEATNAAAIRVVARATINGRAVRKDVGGLGTLRLGPAPKIFVGLEPDGPATTNTFDPGIKSAGPVELTIAPGQTLPAWLRIKRNGHDDIVTFFAENLPHGVIVADIGLNGVLIPKGENERRIFFNAARWVPDQDRLFYMIEQQAGRQTSLPILLQVRSAWPKQAAAGPPR